MVTQVTMSCSEAVVIYFVSITYKKSTANQLLSITANFVSSRNGKERCVIAQNGCMGDQFPTRLAHYCVDTNGASTQRR